MGIGTNASSNQNHLKILKELADFDTDILNKIHFIVPLGYPKITSSYLQEVKDHIPTVLKSCITLDTHFHKGSELATYRCCTDILIQLQTTDQFSGAMQEVMASGGNVITGAWLPYEILKEKKVHFWTISEFAELTDALKGVTFNPITKEQALHNTDVINSLSNWNMVIAIG